MKTFLISPPFGNFIRHSKCTSVMGTYTLHRRGGWLTKVYRFILTVRPTEQGWVNNIGFQNPGIKTVKNFHPDRIYSLSTIQPEEWTPLLAYVPANMTVELNLSCPNLGHPTDIEDADVVAAINKFRTVIFKLSPTEYMDGQVDRLVRLGAKHLHISNALPTPRGGESGNRLKVFSLAAIRKIKEKYPGLIIIGGGGIYSVADVELYRLVGTEYFSLASIWFKPWQAIRLLRNY